MKWAYNDNGILRDVVMTHPSILFAAWYAEKFIEVPDDAHNGWLWDGEVATEPTPLPVPEISEPTKEELLAQLQALQEQIAAISE